MSEAWDRRKSDVWETEFDEIQFVSKAVEKIATKSRINELYHAIQTVERYGGCSPEETETVNQLGKRMAELREHLVTLD